MRDDELLAAFENCTLPRAQWTHRCHVKVAYLYLRELSYEDALAKIRDGIKRYNAAHAVSESPRSGYNETTTQAFFRLVATIMAAYGESMPTSTADSFCDAHPQLMTPAALRFFYSPSRRADPRSKTQFIEPDLAPLPSTQKTGQTVHRTSFRPKKDGAKETIEASAIITLERPDTPCAVELISELETHLESLYPRESRHGYSVDKLIAEEVAFFVLRYDDLPAGCGGVQLFGSEYGEVKRMYVRPKFRGLGFGKLILDHLANYARDRGVDVLRLETGVYQPAAVRLYERTGFQRIGPFGSYIEDPLCLYYEKRLGVSP